jgi:hypothetical protein
MKGDAMIQLKTAKGMKKTVKSGSQIQPFKWLQMNFVEPSQMIDAYLRLMGWPLGWTNLNELEMDKFQQWFERHGTSCAKEPPPEHCGNGQHSIQQRQYAIPLDIKE